MKEICIFHGRILKIHFEKEVINMHRCGHSKLKVFLNHGLQVKLLIS